ncbi:MAG: TonB-dependent receptor [Calditrichaeota bacterium]|nr:MAG: TonB-dependent receptor [Calditrichota bacterium]
MSRFSTISRIFLFATFLIFTVNPLWAATGKVAGTVTDANSGEALAGANVEVLDHFTGAATDENGEFLITLEEGTYTLRASFTGYKSMDKTVTVKAGENTEVNFALEEAVVELGDVVVVLGSRGKKARTQTETPVPVDVLDIEQLVSQAPQVTVNQILNYAAPSFSSNTQTISDGTDHIDPASLRGLGPDQVLVLINGKRRHTTSLVNVNGTFGRGNVGTDLNAIPSAAIKRIEVLRDGAAAQYGSDAIAGVINIVLKDQTNALTATANTGAYFSKESEGTYDGMDKILSVNYGLPIGDHGGFINFTGMYEDRGHTNRMKEYTGTIFKGYNNPDYTGDPNDDITESELQRRGLTRQDFNMRVGQAALQSGQAFMNMGVPISRNSEFYAFGGLSYRHGNSAGFYRLPYQERTVTSVYPNGFLPQINSHIFDKSLAMGIKGKLYGWDVDFSNTWGSNSFTFIIGNTLNASLEDRTKTTYNSGGFSFQQNTANFDATRYYDDIMSGLNIAFGAEYRYENYQIHAGEEGSYAKYDKNGDIVTPNTPDSLLVRGPNGAVRPGGAQVFPGFRPANEVDANRNSVAFYTDFELDLTDDLFAEAAYRFEDYSDFGSTNNFKFAGRYKIMDNYSIRGAYSTGFRAPSLHQINFNATSTLFVDGIPNEVGTFSNNSRVAKILGIPKLKEEDSQNLTLGITGKIPEMDLTATVDLYRIDIQNRVVKTGTFKPAYDDNGNPASAKDAELEQLLSSVNATGAAFFANAIDTRTEGIDIVVTHRLDVTDASNLQSNIAATFSQTKQVGDIHASELLSDKLDTYFDETSRIYLEAAVPSTKINITETYNTNDYNIMLRGVYFGEVEEATNNPGNHQVFSAKWIFDASIGYRLTDNLNITVGANNLLDTYPDKNIPANQSSGRFLYSRRSQQFGFNGRFLFTRLSFQL